MITAQEEKRILKAAYIPEHIVSLMVLLSKGEPFLVEDYLIFAKDNWLIFVGYPLDRIFSQKRCENIIKQVLERFKTEFLWFIGPEIPSYLLNSYTERETDQYYKLDLDQFKLKSSLKRLVEKASEELSVERSHSFSKDHEGLVEELLKREKLTPRVRELYFAMPEYVSRSQSSCVLNARDKNGKLCAFYVIDLGGENFSTYVVGCHSKKHYVPNASDLLFLEMINLTREHGKSTINLGLGVNEGIKRFKKKWGGVPFLKYEFCEVFYGTTRTLPLIESLISKL